MEDANMRRIYRGKGYPNPLHCERLAEMLSMDPVEVIRYVQEDKAKNEEDKEFLRARLPRILPTTCVALAVVGASLKLSIALSGDASSQSVDPLYIMRSRNRGARSQFAAAAQLRKSIGHKIRASLRLLRPYGVTDLSGLASI